MPGSASDVILKIVILFLVVIILVAGFPAFAVCPGIVSFFVPF